MLLLLATHAVGPETGDFPSALDMPAAAVASTGELVRARTLDASVSDVASLDGAPWP